MNNGLNSRKVIVFQLREEEYAIDVQQVGSIERMVPITRVPQVSNFIKGVINLRGVIIPVIDLQQRFGLGALEINDSTRIIIVRIEEMNVGLIVDSANDVLDIPMDMIESTPEVIGSVKDDYLEGVAKIDNRLLILLDISKVLYQEKLEELAEG
ncbi:purine-binding chemotaxis protein CheW [Oceanobacillus halophilus]|uniref:Purine-binding chemotaxis protein CheW n=2 Tax=Oceanobacillus halophilus TaxID=930130 RepID=A0A495ADE4_9BACI|nr:chemotaxis protein CheW [Oceanobacillus halophilus]RKQ37999.1 purine-binding chemotaxis protein CheW [Oceanobacillus halophilus]